MSHVRLNVALGGCIFALVCAGCVGPGDMQVPIPLLPVALATQSYYMDREVVRVGPEMDTSNTDAYVYGVSDHFGTNDLRRLYDIVTSDTFQSALTNYACGDPVPRFRFSLTLYRRPGEKTNALSVTWRYSPRLAIRDRGVDCGLHYLVKKAFGSIEAARREDSFDRVVRAPHVDCSKRPAEGQPVHSFTAGGAEDWVTYPGPDEMLWGAPRL
jgi:hypothetical protein